MQQDEILAVDGESYEDYPDQEAFIDLIGGDEGTDVTLELRHFGETESYEVTITRQRITVKTVSWAMMPGLLVARTFGEMPFWSRFM